MNYQQTIEFLYAVTPVFEKDGLTAYKPGLERMIGMAEELNNPHKKFKSIHVAGTNGKGSVCSTLASIMIEGGYKTGLFTSPHLVSFRERIRVNGELIPQEYVVSFVKRITPLIEKWRPSFFEITTLMGFDYFASKNVDIAIIEVGMGGRLDSTNIIMPMLSIVTNISLDHTQFLGETTEEIASEKAGIFKQGIPIVIGEADNKLRKIYEDKATKIGAPIIFTQDNTQCNSIEDKEDSLFVKDSKYGSFPTKLTGRSQHSNTRTILQALQTMENYHLFYFSNIQVQKGFKRVIENSHLIGRWQKVANNPTVILDTGHNLAGIENNLQSLKHERYKKLHIVFGMVSDKDWKKVLKILPQEAKYYFVSPVSDRSVSSKELYSFAQSMGYEAEYYNNIIEGYQNAMKNSEKEDLVLVGGSNMVVADVIAKAFPEIITTNK